VKSTDRTNSARVQKVMSRLERICARLPEAASAIDQFGHTSYRIANKPFVILGEDQGKPSLAIKTDLATQDVLVKGGQYFRTPYVGQHGWVTLRDDIAANWEEVEGLIRDAYKRVAPKRLADQVED
jgi:predicted DNA-binding protein (MmcQ/YjbR family)